MSTGEKSSGNALRPGQIYSPPYPWQVTVFGGFCSSVLLVATIVAAVIAWQKQNPAIVYGFGGVWAIVPPMWFWWEYFFLYRVKGNKEQFEEFKYGQQVSIAIWAGVALALFALATSEHMKGPAPSTKIESNP